MVFFLSRPPCVQKHCFYLSISVWYCVCPVSNKHIDDKYFILFYFILFYFMNVFCLIIVIIFSFRLCRFVPESSFRTSRTGQLLYKSWHVRLCQVAGFAHAPHCVRRERAAAIVFTRVRFIILTLQSLGGPGDLPCCLWRLWESVGRQTRPSNYTVQNRCSVE